METRVGLFVAFLWLFLSLSSSFFVCVDKRLASFKSSGKSKCTNRQIDSGTVGVAAWGPGQRMQRKAKLAERRGERRKQTLAAFCQHYQLRLRLFGGSCKRTFPLLSPSSHLRLPSLPAHRQQCRHATQDARFICLKQSESRARCCCCCCCPSCLLLLLESRLRRRRRQPHPSPGHLLFKLNWKSCPFYRTLSGRSAFPRRHDVPPPCRTTRLNNVMSQSGSTFSRTHSQSETERERDVCWLFLIFCSERCN